jgi:hypothetical protein
MIGAHVSLFEPQVADAVMTEILVQLGAIIFQAGAFAALVVITPVLYGLVVAMRRWWLVIASAIVLLGALTWLSFDPDSAAALRHLPEAMAPNTAGYGMVAVSYVLLAVIVRLATLRLEWLGWKRKAIKDIHVIGYLAPTVAAIVLVVPSV